MVIFQILDYEPNQIMYVTLTICIPFVDFADSADKIYQGVSNFCFDIILLAVPAADLLIFIILIDFQ